MYRRTKITCSGVKFRLILNSSEMFYADDTKFSCIACKWIEAEAVKIGMNIHDKMCGDGVESRMKVWTLDKKGGKPPPYFLVNGDQPETHIVYQFHEVIGKDILV